MKSYNAGIYIVSHNTHERKSDITKIRFPLNSYPRFFSTYRERYYARTNDSF